MVQEVEGCPAKTVISLKIGKIGEIAVLAKINYDKCYMRLKGAQQKLGFLQFLGFVEKIAKYKE